MRDVFPELHHRAKHIVDTTRAEEERFLATIDGGMALRRARARGDTQGSLAIRGTIAGEDTFRLYDTFGFPIDLTELMARERGYTVDIAGFERALAGQRKQIAGERKTRELAVADDARGGGLADWERASGASANDVHGSLATTPWKSRRRVVAVRRLEGGRVAVILRETPVLRGVRRPGLRHRRDRRRRDGAWTSTM